MTIDSSTSAGSPVDRVRELLAEARAVAEVEFQRSAHGSFEAVMWAGVCDELDGTRRLLGQVGTGGAA